MANAKTAPKAQAATETKETAAPESQATAVLDSLKSTYENATENFKGYGESLSQARTVANETVRSTANGVIAFDRALLNIFRANLDNFVEHGRSIVKAPSIAAAAEQHKNYLAKQIEVVSGQIKDLSDVAEAQSKASMAPLFAAIDGMATPAKGKKDKAA